MPTKLSVFNKALRILGQPTIATVDQNDEAGRFLRASWEESVNACYEVGNWNSAIERAELSQSATAPGWGYDYYYELPDDFVRLVQISSTGDINEDFTAYRPENGMIATNASTLFIRYVSSNLLTLAPGEWTQAFANFVSATLAVDCAPKLNPTGLELASQQQEIFKKTALSIDAIQDPPAQRKPGSFTMAQRGYRGGRSNSGEQG